VDVTQRTTASAELLYVNREARFYFYPPSLPGLPVAAGSASNPFGTTVLVHRLLTEMGPQYQSLDSTLKRGVASLHGGWGQWDWELSALHSKESASTWIHNQLDFQNGALLGALNSPSVLNPFQSGPVASSEIMNSLLAPRDVVEFASIGTQYAAHVAGTVKELWAGPLTAMIGIEQRREEVEFNRDVQASARDVNAAYAQLRLPLLGSNTRWSHGQELMFTYGTRYDYYSGMGDVRPSQYGLQWKPYRSLTVKASTGRSFRPPSLYELYLTTIPTLMRVNDPARNEPANVIVTTGGNRDLLPSNGKSLTAGILFNPEGPMNWRLSADYWRVDMDARVVMLPVAQLLANEAQFADRVTRADRTAADIAANRPGALREVDGSRINSGRVQVSGVDFAIRSSFQTRFGEFRPELLATWFDEYLSVDVPGQPVTDRVDLASELGTILEWRSIFSLGWARGPFGATAVARYTPSYDDAVVGVRNQRTIRAQTLLDLQGVIHFDELFDASLWKGVKLTAGASNVLNEEPRFAEVGGALGFDLSQGDLKQRFLYMQIEKKF
jgi:iron complex outermembrane receptor protein